jgi:hypothetical protein
MCRFHPSYVVVNQQAPASLDQIDVTRPNHVTHNCRTKPCHSQLQDLLDRNMAQPHITDMLVTSLNSPQQCKSAADCHIAACRSFKCRPPSVRMMRVRFDLCKHKSTHQHGPLWATWSVRQNGHNTQSHPWRGT